MDLQAAEKVLAQLASVSGRVANIASLRDDLAQVLGGMGDDCAHDGDLRGGV